MDDIETDENISFGKQVYMVTVQRKEAESMVLALRNRVR